jgi:hypothetical protein
MTAMSNDPNVPSRLPRERSASTAALDNLVRRKLRVSNPSDPKEVANALKSLYTGESKALDSEASGLPFFLVQRICTDTTSAATSTRVEMIQAKQDVERDLLNLVSHTALKDVQAELRGWQQAIGRLVADGTEAARFGLDPRQRDAAMAARRQLGAYARLSRYVGALTPNMSLHYRQLAKSLDEVAALIVVALGDSIASAGSGGARFLLQAPASELQGRRDAVIYALRNLVGTTQEGYGPNDWPRGLVAYRKFIDKLEEGGHTDLRVLFQEGYVARVLDELVHYTTGGGVDDLRALAATSAPTLERFRRLIILSTRLVDPESPPLASYLNALQFFLDAFENGGSGARLLYISRPPIVFYGLYGNSGVEDPGTKRLLALVTARGQLAEQLDCYMNCACGPSLARCQIILDKLLFDVDRAIDLYVAGKIGKEGDPEIRAAAYGVLINQFLANPGPGDSAPSIGPELGDVAKLKADPDEHTACVCTNDCIEPKGPIDLLLQEIRDLLWWTTPGVAGGDKTFDFTGFSFTDDNGLSQVAGGFNNVGFGNLGQKVRDVLDSIAGHATVSASELDVSVSDEAHKAALLELMRKLGAMHQELCLQRSMDRQWDGLLRTLAPSCLRFGGDSILATEQLLDLAIARVQLRDACPAYEPDIPPHFETSLAGISYLRNSEG